MNFVKENPSSIQEARTFAASYGFSERESEIFCLIAFKSYQTEDIANELSISPNTAANHVRNILEKSHARSKTDLLALFCKTVLKKYLHNRLFTKPPRILVVDDEPDLCEILQDFLQLKGAKVYIETNPNKVLEKLPLLHLDFIISDISMPECNGLEMVKRIREVFPALPMIFMITADPNYTLEQCLHEGAAALFSKPVDMETLYFTILEHYIESDFERSRFLRATAELPIKVAKKLDLTTENVGFGGLFIPVKKKSEWNKINANIGDHVEITLSLTKNGLPINAIGEVMWTRYQSRVHLPSGFGIKFTEIEPIDLDNIRDFVRMNRIRSFIPNGE